MTQPTALSESAFSQKQTFAFRIMETDDGHYEEGA